MPRLDFLDVLSTHGGPAFDRSASGVSPDLLALLDRGEAEVSALAEELDADEVIRDERAARAIAITRGLPVIGSAGV